MLLLAIAMAAVTGPIYDPKAPAEVILPLKVPPPGYMVVIDPNRFAPASCPPISRYDTSKRDGKLHLRKLNELPDADVFNAVYRRVGGCEAPIIVKYRVGER